MNHTKPNQSSYNIVKYTNVTLLLTLVIALAYAFTLKNGFVWDDETLIVNNPYVQNIHSLGDYFFEAKSLATDSTMASSYRPLQTLSFALEYQVWNGKAAGFHFTSLLLHLFTCLSIIFLFREFVGVKLAVISAFVFAVHPALSEGVINLAARGNQLYTLFALLSMGLFVRIKSPFDIKHLTSLLFLAMALFSKEPAVATIGLMGILHYYFVRLGNPVSIKKNLLLYSPVLLLILLYLVVRANVVDITIEGTYWGGSLVATLLMQAKVFCIYLWLLVFPYVLNVRYVILPPQGLFDWPIILAVLVNLGLLLGALFGARKHPAGKYFSAAILWFYFSLGPTSNIIPIPGSMLGERFLYMTFAGMFPLLVAAVNALPFKPSFKWTLPLTTLFLISFLYRDITRVGDWKNNEVFFTLLSSQAPNEYIVQMRMVGIEIDNNKFASARQRLERVLDYQTSQGKTIVSPEFYYAYGKVLQLNKEHSLASVQFEKVNQTWSELPQDFYTRWGEALARTGRLPDAKRVLLKGLKKTPDNPKTLNALANVMWMMGDLQGAAESYQKSLNLDPQNKKTRANLQNVKQKLILP